MRDLSHSPGLLNSRDHHRPVIRTPHTIGSLPIRGPRHLFYCCITPEDTTAALP